jgi:hypothetical protein
MPLRKYRSVQGVPSSAVMKEDDPAAVLRLAFSLSALALRLARWRPPSGVHKSRSLRHKRFARHGSAAADAVCGGGRCRTCDLSLVRQVTPSAMLTSEDAGQP